jgi:hypothetical protein
LPESHMHRHMGLLFLMTMRIATNTLSKRIFHYSNLFQENHFLPVLYIQIFPGCSPKRGEIQKEVPGSSQQ